MPVTFQQLQESLDDRIQDAAHKLPADARDRALRQTIVGRYSKDRPRELVTDVQGTGVADIPTPVNGDEKFDSAFCYIKQIEYPTGSVPAEYLDSQDWDIYATPTGTKIRMLASIPNQNEVVRVTWTRPHLDDGSSVSPTDIDAICDYAASLCFDKMAALYLQTVDPTIQSDAVNYRTKSQEALGLARAYRKRYFDHMDLREDASGSATSQPAIAIGDMDLELTPGVDRLIHDRRSR